MVQTNVKSFEKLFRAHRKKYSLKYIFFEKIFTKNSIYKFLYKKENRLFPPLAFPQSLAKNNAKKDCLAQSFFENEALPNAHAVNVQIDNSPIGIGGKRFVFCVIGMAGNQQGRHARGEQHGVVRRAVCSQEKHHVSRLYL